MAHRRCSLALALTLTSLLLMAASHQVRACSCALIEPDTAYQQAFLIFTGTAEKVTWPTREVIQDGKPVLDPEGRPTFRSEGYIARFSVQEYFKGAGGTEIELRGSGTSCDVSFEVGKRYLVYASQNGNTGTLGAFSCSRTTLLDGYAQPDLNYLRRAARGVLPTMLYGFVFRSTGESKLGESEPVGELVVTVEGAGKRLDLKTNGSGYFETFDLPPGIYRVRTGVTGKLRGAEEKAIELGSERVASATFHTTTMGSLSGRIIDQEGQPAGEIMVDLLPAKSLPGARPKLNYDTTSEDGKFNFDEVPAGRYVLAVNFRGRRSLYGAPFLPSYYPNAASHAEAQIITMSDGVPVELGDFVLQKRYPTVAVNGVVVTSDGKPIPGAYVYLEQSGGERDQARAVQTDADGRFVQQAFEGVTYTLRAHADGPTGGAIESDHIEVMAVKNLVPVRLVVKIPK
jgi:5-hydroxyisourate hydrolase-like protein (transthyretin family)